MAMQGVTVIPPPAPVSVNPTAWSDALMAQLSANIQAQGLSSPDISPIARGSGNDGDAVSDSDVLHSSLGALHTAITEQLSALAADGVAFPSSDVWKAMTANLSSSLSFAAAARVSASSASATDESDAQWSLLQRVSQCTQMTASVGEAWSNGTIRASTAHALLAGVADALQAM